MARPCRGSCLPCGWLWWLWLWPVVRALVTSGDTKVTVCLFYGIVPNVIVYIDIYYILALLYLPYSRLSLVVTMLSALAILPLPVVASAVARRQAACRLLVHTVCQAGMKAGGRWLSGHEADGCRRGPNRFPGASAGVGQCPGSRPAAAGAVWPVDGGRPAFTYGPCRVAVRPVPWRVGGLVVAGVVFFPSGKGEFLFSAQFSPAIICILSSLCVIFAIDNQHPGNHGPGPLGARLRYPRKNNAGSLGRPARPAPARRGITEKLKL